jgi:hypothetical protein
LREQLASRGVRLSGTDAYLRRIYASAHNHAMAVGDCHPGERFLFINESGVVSPCSFTSSGYGIPLAELDGPKALQQLPRRFAQLRRERRAPACEDCQSTQVFEKFAA